MNILIISLLVLHVIICLLLLLIVLMQRPRSEGLGTAFGSAVTDTLFGSNTGNVLTKITNTLGVLFFLTTIVLAWLYSHQSSNSLASRMEKAAIAATNAPPAEATVANTNQSNAVPPPVTTVPAASTPLGSSNPTPAPAPKPAK